MNDRAEELTERKKERRKGRKEEREVEKENEKKQRTGDVFDARSPRRCSTKRIRRENAFVPLPISRLGFSLSNVGARVRRFLFDRWARDRAREKREKLDDALEWRKLDRTKRVVC